MPDIEVRLRMLRGRSPRAHVEVHDCRVLTADEEWTKRQAEHQKILQRREEGEFVHYGRGVESREYFEAPKRDYDEWSCILTIVNTGELTIRDFLLSLRFETDLKPYGSGRPLPPREELRYRFAEGVHKSVLMNAPMSSEEYIMPEKKLFPNDRVVFPNDEWTVRFPVGSPMSVHPFTLHWTVYLDNAPPSSGDIDLIARFQESRSPR